jgi:glutathione S-transferase
VRRASLFLSFATRWCDDENFAKGPGQFFKAIPMPLRPIVQTVVRRKVRKTVELQGLGRHTRAEQDTLAIADVEALATLLGEKPFLMGEKTCGAAVFGFVVSILAPVFTSEVRAAAEEYQNLIRYRDRIQNDYFKS